MCMRFAGKTFHLNETSQYGFQTCCLLRAPDENSPGVSSANSVPTPAAETEYTIVISSSVVSKTLHCEKYHTGLMSWITLFFIHFE